MFEYLYLYYGLFFWLLVYALLAAYFNGKSESIAIRSQQAIDLESCRKNLAKIATDLHLSNEALLNRDKEIKLLKAEIVTLKLALENAYEALSLEPKQ